MTMRVLVTGATGFVGSNVCHRLTQEGSEIRIVRRSTSSVERLAGLDFDERVGELTDLSLLEQAMSGCDAVIHAALDDPRADAAGTRAVAGAASRLMPRVVHISSVVTIGRPPRNGELADETMPPSSGNEPTDYAAAKTRAEAVVLDACAQGLNAVVVNPSGIFGRNGDGLRNRELMDRVARHRVVPFFAGGICLAHIDDVVECVVSALVLGRSGERYILGGENVTFKQAGEITAAALGVQRTFVPVPSLVAAGTAAASSGLSRVARTADRFPRSAYRYVSTRNFFDSSKATRELGYTARPFAAIAQEYALFCDSREADVKKS